MHFILNFGSSFDPVFTREPRSKYTKSFIRVCVHLYFLRCCLALYLFSWKQLEDNDNTERIPHVSRPRYHTVTELTAQVNRIVDYSVSNITSAYKYILTSVRDSSKLNRLLVFWFGQKCSFFFIWVRSCILLLKHPFRFQCLPIKGIIIFTSSTFQIWGFVDV